MKYWAFSSHLKSHESHEQINSLKVRALYYVQLNMIISFIQIPLFPLQKKTSNMSTSLFKKGVKS